MRVLITGGAGRIGVDVCKTFLENGFQVRAFDLDTPVTRGRIKKLHGKAEIYWGDITQLESLRKALEGIDAVVHTAAMLPPKCVATPELTRKVNVDGTRNVAQAVKEKGGSIPFVYTSTEAVYGNISELTEPIDLDKFPPVPKGIYPETKIQGEQKIKETGVACVILRLTTGWQLTLSKQDRQQMFRIPLNNRVEICCRVDACRAILSAIKNFDKLKGNTFMVSSGTNGKILHQDRVRGYLKCMGLPMPPASKFGQGPTHYNWFVTTRTEKMLPYPKSTFEEFLAVYRKDMSALYSPFFLPLMRYFIGPLFGKLIIKRF
jgi:nucleoside-diphosphate-sugar epimerase